MKQCIHSFLVILIGLCLFGYSQTFTPIEDLEFEHSFSCGLNLIQNITNENIVHRKGKGDTVYVQQNKSLRASLDAIEPSVSVTSDKLKGTCAAALLDNDNDGDIIFLIDELSMDFQPIEHLSIMTGYFSVPFGVGESRMPLGSVIEDGIEVIDTVLQEIDDSQTPPETTIVEVPRVIGSMSFKSKGIRVGFEKNNLSFNFTLYNQLIKSILESEKPNPYHLDAFAAQVGYTYKELANVSLSLRNELFNYRDIDLYLFLKPVSFASISYETILGLTSQTGKRQNSFTTEVSLYPDEKLTITGAYAKLRDGAQESSGLEYYGMGVSLNVLENYTFGVEFQSQSDIVENQYTGWKSKIAFQFLFEM